MEVPFNLWDRLMSTNHQDYEARFREVTSREKTGSFRGPVQSGKGGAGGA